jgi:putative DNA primase/helicase
MTVLDFPPTNDPLCPPAYSDEALAQRYTRDYGKESRFCGDARKWLVFNGKIWEWDNRRRVFSWSRKVCLEAALECDGDTRTAKALASSKTVAAAVTMASSDQSMSVITTELDRDPWLLSTPGGVVDLQTGLLRTHDPSDLITKMAGAAPDKDMPTPLWLSFLDRIMAGDKELIAYLQRMCGYMLTGSTREDALFFLYGGGANGKSTFIDVLIAVLGDYQRCAAMEWFVASKTERHPTDMAGLCGARLATASETEQGRPWAEEKIKQLTGGDPITARFMRGDFFDYVPTFKLLFFGNHKPKIVNVDEAMRRRFNLIPFSVTIPVAERDKTLGDKLLLELPGILSWMIEGCLRWQSDGLDQPKAVKDATAAYLQSQDLIAAWIEDCTSVDYNRHEDTNDLYHSYSKWLERNGEAMVQLSNFKESLNRRPGLLAHRSMTGRGYKGLRLRPSYTYGEKECEP